MSTNKWVKYAGVLLTLSCLVYIGIHLHDKMQSMVWPGWSPGLVFALLFCIVAWMVVHVFLVLAWRELLRWADINVPLKLITAIMFRSQIGKYLPGNVMHFAGRVILSRIAGVPVARVSATVALEIVLILGAAVMIGLPMINRILAVHFRLWIAAGIIVALLLAAASFFWMPSRRKIMRLLQAVNLKRLDYPIKAMIYYGMIFLLSGYAIHLMSVYFCPEADLKPGMVISAFALSWSVGFVVIGSPGGVGVREALFSVLLAGSATASDLVMLMVAHRVLTTLADVLVFCLSFALGTNLTAPANPNKLSDHTELIPPVDG